jgi:hypothetical protein
MGRSRNLSGADAEFRTLEAAMNQLHTELIAIAPQEQTKRRTTTRTKRKTNPANSRKRRKK